MQPMWEERGIHQPPSKHVWVHEYHMGLGLLGGSSIWKKMRQNSRKIKKTGKRNLEKWPGKPYLMFESRICDMGDLEENKLADISG